MHWDPNRTEQSLEGASELVRPVQGGAANAIGAKNASIFCTIYAKDDRFVKTGSGQTQGKHSKRDAFFAGAAIAQTSGTVDRVFR